MKIKLDENLGQKVYQLFKETYPDVETVSNENLSGSPDEKIYSICKKERRILVTLDLDFSNIIRFPLQDLAGIIILRPSPRSFYDSVLQLVRVVIKELETRPILNILWIVQPGKIKVCPALTLLASKEESSD